MEKIQLKQKATNGGDDQQTVTTPKLYQLSVEELNKVIGGKSIHDAEGPRPCSYHSGIIAHHKSELKPRRIESLGYGCSTLHDTSSSA